MFTFENLEASQHAIDFADLTYNQTRSSPPDERFGLTNQTRRAAVSVSSNLAEGSSRSRPDFARFAEISGGSLFEVVSQPFLAKKQNFLADDDSKKLYASAEREGKILNGLRHFLLKG